MNALLHDFPAESAPTMPQGPVATTADILPGFAPLPDRAVVMAQWEAVLEAAAAVAALGGIAREPLSPELLAVPRRVPASDDGRYLRLASAIDDLAAILQPGLRALLMLTAKGRDTTTAARTLWREYHAARGAILALADAR